MVIKIVFKIKDKIMAINPVEKAEKYIGIGDRPGIGSNREVLNWLKRIDNTVTDDDTSWCSAFVNFICDELGLESTNSLSARSWLQIGNKISIDYAKKGDVVILKRGKGKQPGPEVIKAKGHVGFFVSANSSYVTILGGNQHDIHNYDEVCIKKYDIDKVLGIRRMSSKRR
jgi:uncharacterized protein (TIGR02594 family)